MCPVPMPDRQLPIRQSSKLLFGYYPFRSPITQSPKLPGSITHTLDVLVQRAHDFILFVSQRNHGIDPSGATRWNVAGKQRYHRKDQGARDEAKQVQRLDSKQHADKQARG